MISHFGRYTEEEAEKYSLRAINTDSGFKQKLADALKELS